MFSTLLLRLASSVKSNTGAIPLLLPLPLPPLPPPLVLLPPLLLLVWPTK